MDTIAKLNTGLIITVLGMGIVFCALIFLSLVLKSMEIISRNRHARAGETGRVNGTVAGPRAARRDDTELVAVIIAGVMSMGEEGKSLTVRSITRAADGAPVWGRAGRGDQMANRL
ncbi:MAG TPA: hypothetical protein ENN21_03280 [Spirochaetes bacterium]|nr:hypothetical protein [Spirochaetota bacterium]